MVSEQQTRSNTFRFPFICLSKFCSNGDGSKEKDNGCIGEKVCCCKSWVGSTTAKETQSNTSWGT